MATAETVKVSGRYQISLPSHARHALGIEAGDRLLVVVQDGMLILLPRPDDFAGYLAGLHREVWQGVDTTTYLNEERARWSISDEA
jgi:AbrB family looped-hinge helix DNA binding protein